MQQRDDESMPVGPEAIRQLWAKIRELERKIAKLERKATS